MTHRPNIQAGSNVNTVLNAVSDSFQWMDFTIRSPYPPTSKQCNSIEYWVNYGTFTLTIIQSKLLQNLKLYDVRYIPYSGKCTVLLNGFQSDSGSHCRAFWTEDTQIKNTRLGFCDWNKEVRLKRDTWKKLMLKKTNKTDLKTVKIIRLTPHVLHLHITVVPHQ